MSSQDDIQRKLRAGVEAARGGDRSTARRLLEEVIELDENNEMAWIWLASSVNSVTERRACLERVLQINPNNARAKEALQRLNQEAAPVAPRGDTVEQQRIREQISQVRRIQETVDPTARDTGSTISLTTLVILGLLIVVVIGGGVFVLNILNRNNVVAATPTQVVVLATATDRPTETLTPTITPTFEGISASQVTRMLAPTLPPLFTPTFTPSATLTPLPSATPLGLENYAMLYASLNSGGTQPDIYTINADKSNEGLLIENGRDMDYDEQGNRVVFIRDVDEDGTPIPEVFIAGADGSDPGTQLTSLGSPDTAHPSISLDGSMIIFSSTGGTKSEELWVMNADGTNLRQLTNNELVERDPSFSPVTNNLVLFTSDVNTPGLTQLYTLEVGEGSNPSVRQLTNSSGNNYSASWSQDGKWVVFAGDRSGSGDIYLVDAALGGPGDLVTIGDGEVENRRPAVSGNARLVAYISNRDSENFQTYVIDVNTREVIRLTDNGREDASVSFRPLPPELLESK